MGLPCTLPISPSPANRSPPSWREPTVQGPGRSDSATFKQLPLSPLSSCPCPPGSCHPRHTMPVLKITTWRPERTPDPGHSPPPPHFWASFLAYPSPIPPSIGLALDAVLFTKHNGSRQVGLVPPGLGSSSLSQSAQGTAMGPHWSGAASSRKLPPIKL